MLMHKPRKPSQPLQNRQRGAVPLGEVLGLCLVLIVVSVLAVRQYHKYSYSLNPPVPTLGSATPTPEKTATPTPTSRLAIPVPELGLVITLPNGLSKSDVYYVANTTPQTLQDASGRTYQQVGSVSLSTHSLAAQSSGCAPASTASGSSGLFTIIKYTGNISGYSITPAPHNIKALSDGYIAIADRQSSPCSNTPSSLQDTQYQLFSQAYDSVTSL